MSPVNFGETWVQGVETSLTLSALELLDSETSLTWQLSRNLTEGSAYANNELPRTPELALWQSVSVHWLDRIRCGYTFNFTSPNYWDAGNLYQSAPRTLHGAFIRTRPTERWPTLELSGLNLADSLTEVVPRDPADADDPSRAVAAISDFAGYPLPGRTFLLSVSWTP
jgi:outer membrane receptor for ferrienterochelin and colicin